MVTSAELQRLRADFPVLQRQGRSGRPVVYLDSAATAQKPQVVIDAEVDFYEKRNAAVHRGAHQLAEEATDAFEAAREGIAEFVGAASDEVVFTRNATEGINVIATAIGNASLGRGGAGADRYRLKPGDEIIVTEAEHHANLVPWQELAARTGAQLKWIGITDHGRLATEELQTVVTDRTRIIAFTHASNVLGAVTDVTPFVEAARSVGAITVLDACQSAPHIPLDFARLGVDFAVLSGHKVYGPTGIGVLYGRREMLADLPPAVFGGSMVELVTMTEATFMAPPQRFEAGTPVVAQAVGLHAAVQYLTDIGMDAVARHEQELADYLLPRLGDIPHVTIIGPRESRDRLAVVAFDLAQIHPHDVGQILDDQGIAVRVGHHCAQPVHRRFALAATTRVSAGVHTTIEELDEFLTALAQVRSFFGMED
ncbi:MAG TPA: SufS family cysteine desulfurase [Actinomycetales bacterium]|nr:SufS family cysteine desulfurase [Actinomycetales bacterium]